jgi:hypothetical protein
MIASSRQCHRAPFEVAAAKMLSMHFTPIVQNSKSAPGNRYFGEIRCAGLYLPWASSCTGGTVIQDGGKALPSGTVVGTSDTQTLTNKTTDTASKLNGASFGTAAQATARQCDGWR